jgi:integrase
MAVKQLDNGRYEARYRGADGRERQRRFATKLEAERWERAQRSDVARGTWIDPKAGRVLFGDYAREWQRRQVHHRPNTRRRVATAIETHLEALDRRPLASLRRSDMTALVADLSARLAPSTVRTIMKDLQSILRSAVDDGAIAQSPLRRVPLPEVQRKRVVPLEVSQVAELAGAITPRYRAVVLAGAGCGLRLGELLGLGVDHVAFLERSVHVERQLLDKPTRLGPPKSKHAVRTVPAPGIVLDALAAHIAEFGTGPDGLVFTSPRGGPVRRSGLEHAWRDAVDKAGLEGVTPHDLRHHYASVLLAGGESVVTVAARLGHGSAAVTLRTYAHLMPDSDTRTRQVLDAAWSAGLAGFSRGAQSM